MPIIDGTIGDSGTFTIDGIPHPKGVYPTIDSEHNFTLRFQNGNIYLRQGKVEDWTLADRDGGSEPIIYTYTLIDGITLVTDITRRSSYIQTGFNNRWTFEDSPKFLEADFIPIGSRMAIGENPNKFGSPKTTWTFVTTTRLPEKQGAVWVVDVDRPITVAEYTKLDADKKLRLWKEDNRTEDIGKHLSDISELTFST